ncbi:arsenate reductase (glutaredoxin) [Poritiphilus flavus]|uniref:Arsenate reductase (Glutaredoxin) n=1 Tax=Poritiphilus flavus TaxID=2697053 RepID=A0A6L9EFC1_9FLAO|nr:arsenate reductase (glutaredoxin) [Poritiphilus flavus]NAS13470.1 arsenate reductase (glutaredoxin) [Poritiphilus flavus]
MIKIYHNPRCAKSREGLALLESSGEDFETVLYLKDPFNEKQLEELLSYLDISPEELIRKNEPIWKSEFKGKDLSDKALIKAMVDYPKLIERPIVVKGNKAVIGRPVEKIKDLL